jgi:sugar lactone lactonase YvrE
MFRGVLVLASRDPRPASSTAARRCGSIVVAALAACGNNKAHIDAPPGDGGDAALVDAPPACVLGALTLKVATLSGCDVSGTADGVRSYALFSNPVNVAIEGSGDAYIADFDSSRVRKIDIDGRVTTLVHRTDFAHPFGLAVRSDGFVYVETDDDDQGHHDTTTGTIWKLDPATGDATVIARDIGRPRGLAVLPDGHVAMCDYMHHVVEVLDPTTGVVAILAGMMDAPGYMNATIGTAAQFSSPWDIALLPDGSLVVSDYGNNVLRRVTQGGTVSLYAGTPGTAGNADGTLLGSTFSGPKGLAIITMGLSAGTLYVTEDGNKDVRRVAAGGVGTIAGAQTAGYLDSDMPLAAQFYGVEGLDVSADGTRIIVADGNIGNGMPYNHVRVIHP